ncbi:MULTISPECIES: hypothetical protein [unclassified Streptomyces]|uniref:hypothetical protein n=1 Tax=unclassified Streptomyces TaxID=2593676 RepID=UPI002E2A140B|nr:hypothetical protein [Streptomyces sp. NBC_01429]
MTRPGAGGPVWDFIVTAICLGALAGALMFTGTPERMPPPEDAEACADGAEEGPAAGRR